MYSPSGLIDPGSNNFTNNGPIMDDNCAMNSNLNGSNNMRDVDSLLMLNQYSPPHSSELNSLSLNSNNNSVQHNQQNVSYRRVRPEPINEKTLVSSMVGYFHDVIGTSDNFSKHSQQQNHPQQQHNIVQSGSSTLLSKTPSNIRTPANEIKEQIEWLHYENINLLSSTAYTSSSWNLYQANSGNSNFNNTSKSNVKFQNTNLSSTNFLLVLGYKTGFSIWTIDLNGLATEVLSVREPNITHVKFLQFDSSNKILIAICKLILTDNEPVHSKTSHDEDLSQSSTDIHQDSQPQAPSETQQTQQISIVNLLNGECLHEILFNGTILDMKSNADLLCVNSWNRIDAFDLNTFEHRFSLNSCFSQISKSSGKTTNPFTLGNRWLAFADKKFHVILSSQGGVSTDIEQSYAATVLNTAKSISKGLVKISETVVNSVVSKSKNSSSNCSSSDHSPRGSTSTKNRHDSKEEFQPGICTILDTKKYVNNARKSQQLHDENQSWIVGHFLAHQEPIYALEFNQTGRLLVSADCLGQYFNVFQVNTNSYKCTRTVIKHLYSLYRGDTTSKVTNMCFSNDSRWLAIGTKRGTTHIFPLNSYGGVVNARTHSKPHIVNRTAKHQRTAGFIETDDANSTNSNMNPLYNHANLNSNEIQQLQMQQMLQQHYDNSFSSPLLYNNNPKLRTLMEPFIIPAYAQLKQPNINSTFQSSVISSNATHTHSSLYNGLLTAVNSSSEHEKTNGTSSSSAAANLNNSVANNGINGPNMAATALTSAALVTENMTQFGIQNFSLLASNTTNLIQYDNVCSIAIFGESRGYLSPEEPRDNRLKAANSLFVISDVNGNLVEYVLDVLIDSNKAAGSKATNDSPILLKVIPKAQWSLQRIVATDELKYPIQPDNPLLCNNTHNLKKQRNNSNDQQIAYMQMNHQNIHSQSIQNGFNSLDSYNSFQTAPSSLVVQTSNNDEWIKQIEVTTHIGPHRRLFMGPQFVFKTFNSNLTTTKLTSNSSSVISDVETPIIDLSGDIELNTLDLNPNNVTSSGLPTRKEKAHLTQPVQITHSLSKTLKAQQKFDCTPTYIEVGAGSFQEGMPILCGSQGSRGSQKSLNKDVDLLTDSIAESLADAMNDLNTSHQHNLPFPQRILQQNRQRQAQNSSTPAIAITNQQVFNGTKSNQSDALLINQNNNQCVANVPILTPSSSGSNNSVFTPGSYFLINPTIAGDQTVCAPTSAGSNQHAISTMHQHEPTSSASFTSSGSNSSNNSANINNDDDNSGVSSNNSSIHNSLTMTKRATDLPGPYHRINAPSLENIQFQEETNLLH